MSPAKQSYLHSRYPNLFNHKVLLPTDTYIWGKENGDGWFALIENLCSQLTLLARTTGLEIGIARGKTKLGALKVHFQIEAFLEGSLPGRDHLLWSSIVGVLINRAERLSEQTCEETGEDGQLYVSLGGWYHVVSPVKAAERGYITEEEWKRKNL